MRSVGSQRTHADPDPAPGRAGTRPATPSTRSYGPPIQTANADLAPGVERSVPYPYLMQRVVERLGGDWRRGVD